MMAAPRRRMLRSIRGRVAGGAILIVAIALILGSIGAVLLLRTSLTDGVEVAVTQDIDTLGEHAERDPRAIEEVDDEILVRLDGAEVVLNDEDAALLRPVPEDSVTRIDVDGVAYLAVSESVDDGTITIARSLEHVDEAVGVTTMLLSIAVPLVIALVGLVVWIMAGRALAPVERLRAQVDAIDASDLHRRVEPGDDAELAALTGTMNRMLDRIEAAQATQRRFASDASHELRSPLATIRQHAELAAAHPETTSLDALSGVVLDEGARMQELVEDLLLLARLDERRERNRTPIDMDDIALAEVRRMRGLGVDIDGRGIAHGRVLGNPGLLARAVRNLVDNAARHARSRVSIRVLRHGSWVVTQVEDDGAGIPVEQRDHVFERFARLDDSRARDAGGSGLGLAIVREITLAHGGTILIDTGADGGALFSLALPAAADRAS